ncbi:1-deoxy-D-xylulose-5-phosphate reductoisomerase [Aeromonas bestiarum]|jgi:1-deoxy-D-xylulose-5-phosphate reductoisomerase|uniref:1-deoxy-D-xylulose 5-phosphate reductoisomerase n=1 Tax=Aeromonas bestiarum TaxID=105751 RepID=A0AAW7HWK4_9GAMM|nr:MULTISPECIES: 1-deoxy-D-xylulose-5-phosphate reductoisomerase [Aeromonas]MCH7346106.1 1-deoxy-D-xylulose-5-phosphate reductoisomerase [Aeromonas sp. MR7]MDM5071084.1 1-deoxy-D-xylulose-5-phosphate reductoisomerase [Aeromonas bestiarum]MDM5087604.1 1-deoxy-D-xylulose-5-phosphate reductoisomerase [Aeromonas bestiarum]MDM5139130.1 1-deoxy-D-xylulose-5-phosphate reductoisomerase [Aeromonas bestiarum]HEH9403440.1 1-deoxy-D-xylulose-5-phosphate reductoisomerase [Aeromonas bestiarum]
MHNLVILGASGSIGQSTLKVLRQNPGRWQVLALTAARSVDAMLRDCLEFSPRFAVMVDEDAAAMLAGRLKSHGSVTRVLSGQAALCEVAAHPDVHSVMAAIVGAAGLAPTMAAVRAGKRILLANKEALVMSGAFFMEAVREHGAELLPIDSEHNAIFQCLPEAIQRQPGFCDLAGAGISKILLTGSGGPFRYTDIQELARVTPAQAIAHPNWSMGAKISVDSATMINKGLEYIEARWLFNAAPEQIQVVIHPQSVIHSMVQYKDGSVLAQLGNPDMCTPIAHALAYPARVESGVEPLDFFSVGEFSFIRPDYERYPCLALAMSACQQGQAATTALNAANEEAVAAFLAERIGFMDIARVNEAIMAALGSSAVGSLDDLIALDGAARARAHNLIEELS